MATPSSKEVLSKIGSHLTCAICLDRYTDPRALPCQHTYCKHCIEEIPEEKGYHMIKCPSCRKFYQLGKEGASALPKAFHINSILEIKESLEKSSENESHPECSRHKKPKDIYCETCDELICYKCSREDHRDHQSDRACDLFEKQKKEITNCLQPVDERIQEVTEMLASFDNTEDEIRGQGEAVKVQIDQIIKQHMYKLEELMGLLQQSRDELFNDTDSVTQQKVELLHSERAELEAVLVQLKSCKEFIQEELKLRSRFQIQSAKKDLIQCISDAHTQVKVSDLQPGQNADTVYVCDPSAFEAYNIILPNVGQVHGSLNYQPVRGLFRVEIPPCVPAREITAVSLQLMTSLPLSVDLISCKLELVDWSAIHVKPVYCAVEQVDEGHFKVMLKPHWPALHKLDVCISDNEVPIYGSPFEVMVVSTAEWRNTKLKVLARGLKHPRDISITDDGVFVIISELQGPRLAVYRTTGEHVYTLNRTSWQSKFANSPVEVAASHGNHAVVKDKECILLLNLISRAFLVRLYDYEVNLKFGRGMAVLPCGSVLIGVCEPNQSVYKLSNNFRALELFAELFEAETCAIAVDSRERVYVLTSRNKILIFKEEGTFIASIGKDAATLSLQLKDPFGMCIDSSNVIYVTDEKEVKIFTTEGEYLNSFGNFSKLRGIAVNKTTGDLFICKASGEVFVSRND